MKFLVSESQFKKVISSIRVEIENHILSEGQNEDRAKQILMSSNIENVEELLSFLKGIDKSKNNKFLPVITTFYVNARNNDQFGSIVDTFKNIFKEKTVPDIILTRDGNISVKGNVFEKNNFEEFKNFIEHYSYKEEEYSEELKKEEARKKEREVELIDVNANKIFENRNFIVWKAIHEKICIQLFGRDYNGRKYPISSNPYCIGWGTLEEPKQHLKGYRTGSDKYTFYAVLDKKRYDRYEETMEYQPSMLNIVGVKGSGSIDVWDEKDSTNNLKPTYETPNQYLEYLEQNGINLQNLFKTIPYVPESNELIDSLLKNPTNEDYFNAMSPFLKREYVKQAQTLTTKQIKFLLGTNDMKSLNNFVQNYTIVKDISKEAFLALPSSLQKSFVRSKLTQMSNNLPNFDFDIFFSNYIINPNLVEYSINFIKDSLEQNKTQNKEMSLRVLGYLSPEEMFKSFAGLEEVRIDKNNFRLSKIPDNLGEYLTEAKELIIKNLDQISSLPSSIGMAKNLGELLIYGCQSLEQIPEEIGNLTNLKILSISKCMALKSLPESIGNLTNLVSLNVHENSSLQYLPDTIGNLENVDVLNISETPLKKIDIEQIQSMTSLIHIAHDDITLKNLSDEEKEFIENFG